MTNAELILKIRNEINYRIEIYIGHAQSCVGTTIIDGLEEVLNFLSTLESEKPVPADLEEAADEMAIRAFPEKKSYSTVYDRVVDYNAVDRKNYRDGIIAGAKWQKEQDQETIKLSEINPFLAGVNYQKEQMIKDAVEGEITKDNRGNNVVRAGVFNKDFEYGDKVRVIVIPNTDKK